MQEPLARVMEQYRKVFDAVWWQKKSDLSLGHLSGMLIGVQGTRS
jgi:hypothetical protein